MALLDNPPDGRTAEGGEMGMTYKEAIDIISRYEVNGCGYCHQGGDEIPEAFNMAINALKARESRVMTLDEIGSALKTPLWKETKRAHKDLYNGWVLAYEIQKGQGITGTRLGMSEPSGRVVWYRVDDYGTTWRCWTSRPTAEQREATPWS